MKNTFTKFMFLSALSMALSSPSLATSSDEDRFILDIITYPKPTLSISRTFNAGSYLAARHALANDDRTAAADFFSKTLQRDKGNEILTRQTLWLMIQTGRFEQARPLAQELIDDNIGDVLPYIAMAVIDIARDYPKKALADLDQWPEYGIAPKMSVFLSAWLNFKIGKPQEAIEKLNEIDNDSALGSLKELHLGLLADLADKPSQALSHFSQALARSETTRTVQGFASFLLRHGQENLAHEVLDNFLSKYPAHADISHLSQNTDQARPLVANANEGIAELLYNLSMAFFHEKLYDNALAYSQMALHLRPDFPHATKLTGDILLYLKRYDEAIVEFKTLPDSPDFYWPKRWRIADAYAANKDWDTAIKVLSADAPQGWPGETDAMRELAFYHRAAKEYKKAIAIYDKLIKDLPPDTTDWSLYYARAVSYHMLDLWTQAETDFLKAIEIEPDDPYLLNYLGYSWLDQGLNMQRAHGLIMRAILQKPTDPHIIDSLGWSYYHRGMYDKAIHQLEIATSMLPSDAVMNDHLGDAYWAAGRYLEAKFQWERVLRYGDDEDVLQSAQEKLDRKIPRIRHTQAE